MADEDQERVEDYLELERYIEALQAGKEAYPPTDLTPEQVRIYQMATLFRSATPENAEPGLAFAEQLKNQLLAAREDIQTTQPESTTLTQSANVAPVAPPTPEQHSVQRQETVRPIRFFSRRGLITGGAIAAASLVIGIGAERVVEQTTAQHNQAGTSLPPNSQLKITNTMPTTWHFVTTLAELGQGAIRFTSDTIVGYVLRDGESVVALSAACTHMGCIVRWQDSDRRFHCPCHSALFAENGVQVNARYRYELPPLPQLYTKVEDGKVYVEVPL